MFFHSLDAAPGVDVEQVVCELHEPVNTAKFELAWRETIARHAILRTSFHWAGDGTPRQVVHAPAHLRPVFRSEEFGSDSEARLGLAEYLAMDRRAGFDLQEAPLLRLALIRGGESRSWFVITFHHLVLDGRAMAVAFREAFDLHDALVAGDTIELPPARSYRLYLDWLETLDLAAQEKFWRAHLGGFAAPVALPLARGSVPAPDDDPVHGELAFRLDEARTARLRETAKSHGVTMNTLLQATWAMLLSHYSGESDVVFGAVRACRHAPVEGAAEIVGPFINTVPVRAQLDPAASLAEWLRGLREQWIALRDHEHTPLVKIQQWSEVAPGRPLFETLLNYQEPSWDAALQAAGGAWAQRSFDIRSQPSFPLALDACGGATLIVKLLFDRARFAADAVARLLGHVRTGLEALADNPPRTLGEWPLLTAFEEEQMRRTWNRTATSYPGNVCVHAFVEANAAELPTRLAVADANVALTYAELNRRANRIAHRLRAQGVGPDVPVAVCMTRSTEMIAAWLGVLKAGGAFVPLDPAYPPERLAFQLHDCGAPVLLTQPHVRPGLPTVSAGVTIVDIEPGGVAFAAEPETNPPSTATATNLAYVIYTSGSTGRPKGVMIEHRSLMNLVSWHQETYRVTSNDRATQLASPAFDAAVWEIWPYLAAGASVHLPEEDVRVSPASLVRWLAQQAITIAFLPTPLAEATFDEEWPRGMALRALLTGGDKLKRPPPENLPCALSNHYGPTESTVVATCGAVAPSLDDATPTIGRPIANTQVHVLDAHRRLVPVGVPGELYLGGASLARGYLNRPELTAEKFVPSPFDGKGEGLRLYRTGDLVRWRADGELEFLGRIDSQVKIRGFRIELGEIEAALQRHPSVREALVLARPDGRGEPQLVAYVLAPPPCAAGYAGELTEYLRSALPAPMVPRAFVFLEAWPLTPNAKIDRAALPAPAETASDASATFAPPTTATEETVAQVWREVLGRPSIGANDNFFDLGGHSLLAAQALSRLNRALGAALTVRSLFDLPTVAALARQIDLKLAAHDAPRPPSLRVRRRASRSERELVQPS